MNQMTSNVFTRFDCEMTQEVAGGLESPHPFECAYASDTAKITVPAMSATKNANANASRVHINVSINRMDHLHQLGRERNDQREKKRQAKNDHCRYDNDFGDHMNECAQGHLRLHVYSHT